MCAKSFQSSLTVCDPVDCNLPETSEHGILQARILEWVAMASSRGLSNPGIEPTSLMSPASTSTFFTTSTSWEARICLRAFLVAQQETLVQFLGQEVSLEKG